VFDSRLGLGIIPFTTASRTALEPTQPPIQWVREALSLGVKRPGREADHSPPPSAEVKNAWSYTSTPHYAFMAWCLVKHRDMDGCYFEKLRVTQLVKIFPAYYRTRRFITVFTTAHPLVSNLSQMSQTQILIFYFCDIHLNIIFLSICPRLQSVIINLFVATKMLFTLSHPCDLYTLTISSSLIWSP
jgi:hypothetical protein